MSKIFLDGSTVESFLKQIGQLIDKKVNLKVDHSPKVNKSKFLTRKEVAALLKISLPTLNELSKSGQLKSYKIGSKVLYKIHEVEDSVRERNFTKSKRRTLFS